MTIYPTIPLACRYNLKGTVSRDFRLLVFFMNQFPPISPAGVADTGGKFATGVVDTGGAPLLANISANFRKNSKRF
jgi:hypothetical protein